MDIDVNEMKIGDWIQYRNASILLNVAILLQNGFEEVGYNYYLLEEDTGKAHRKRRVTIYFSDNVTITLSAPTIERMVWTTQYIPYVHELQHLMRAMGFTKEIEL